MSTSADFEQFKSFKVEYASSDRILIMTLNRPPLNTFVIETYEEISKIVSIAATNKKICAIIFRAEGKYFSAGADVSKFSGDPKDGAIRRLTSRKAAADFYACPVPVIVAVQGAAIGAGMMFAACADIILATEQVFFAMPEINVGVIGGAKVISRLLPQQKIRMMVLTGLRVPVTDVYRLGGVEEIVPSEKLFSTAMKYAEMITDKGSMEARMWKESLVVNEAVGPREGFLIENCLSQELYHFHSNTKVKRQ